MIKSIARPVAGASLKELDDFRFVSGKTGLAGWIHRDISLDMLKPLLDDPDGYLNATPGQALRDTSKIKVVKRQLSSSDGNHRLDVVIKRFRYPRIWRRLGFLLSKSDAVRSMKAALLLERNGIDTAKPVAVLEWRRWRDLGTSYYIATEIKDGQSLDAFWCEVLSGGPRKASARERCQVLREVAYLFFRLHSLGIYHPDLKGANIFIRRQADGIWNCSLVDVDGVCRRKRLSWPRRIKNLVQLQRTLGQHLHFWQRAYLVKRYADLFSLTKERRTALAAEIFADSQRRMATLRDHRPS